jgi:hypothetical protein
VRFALIILSIGLGACLEVIEHTPAGACAVDADCPCGQDCSIRDAGIPLCGPRITHGCTGNHDCPAAHPHCTHPVRDGGACTYLVCE